MPSPKRIGKIEFGLLSPKEIRTMSVRKVIWADTYDDDGFPYPQGLMDLHLGVIDPGLRCKTCDQKASDCPGHFGHIELAKPVIHVGYTRLIRKLLRVTCRSCSRLLLSVEEVEKVVGTEDDLTGDVLSEKDIKKERVCPHCGEQQLKINFEKPTTFSEVLLEEGKKVEHKLTPADIRARLEKIPDEDLRHLGINPDVARPEWTILTVLPVPPVTMRPSIILENGQRSEDDLTHKLVDIIRINQRFKENQDAGAPQLIIEDLWELLQVPLYHLPGQRGCGMPAGQTPQRQTAQDPLPEAEGEGRAVPWLTFRQEGELLGPYSYIPRPQPECHRGGNSPCSGERDVHPGACHSLQYRGAPPDGPRRSGQDHPPAALRGKLRDPPR